jgi:hypothetical protein
MCIIIEHTFAIFVLISYHYTDTPILTYFYICMLRLLVPINFPYEMCTYNDQGLNGHCSIALKVQYCKGFMFFSSQTFCNVLKNKLSFFISILITVYLI